MRLAHNISSSQLLARVGRIRMRKTPKFSPSLSLGLLLAEATVGRLRSFVSCNKERPKWRLRPPVLDDNLDADRKLAPGKRQKLVDTAFALSLYLSLRCSLRFAIRGDLWQSMHKTWTETWTALSLVLIQYRNNLPPRMFVSAR